MFHPANGLQGHLHHIVTDPTCGAGNKTYAAGIVFKFRAIQGVWVWIRHKIFPFQIAKHPASGHITAARFGVWVSVINSGCEILADFAGHVITRMGHLKLFGDLNKWERVACSIR